MKMTQAQAGKAKPYLDCLREIASYTLALSTVVIMASGDFSARANLHSSPLKNARSQRGAHRSVLTPASEADDRGTLAQLDGLLRSEDLKGLSENGNNIEVTWGKAGGEFYGLMMLEISNLIANHFSDFRLSQKHATQALSHADTFSLELETRLLRFLIRDLNSTGNDEWNAERSGKAKLWLHAWQRLEIGVNRNFDFADLPSLNVIPPIETGLPAGVSPAAIKNPKLRAKYETALAANSKKAQEYKLQFGLRYLDHTFTNVAEDYLVRVYAQPPNSISELRSYLMASKLNQAIKKKLLARVTKTISERK